MMESHLQQLSPTALMSLMVLMIPSVASIPAEYRAWGRRTTLKREILLLQTLITFISALVLERHYNMRHKLTPKSDMDDGEAANLKKGRHRDLQSGDGAGAESCGRSRLNREAIAEDAGFVTSLTGKVVLVDAMFPVFPKLNAGGVCTEAALSVSFLPKPLKLKDCDAGFDSIGAGKSKRPDLWLVVGLSACRIKGCENAWPKGLETCSTGAGWPNGVIMGLC
jgi:hypothetical protein